MNTKTENLACNLIISTQSYLIELYAERGIELLGMSNDEFICEYRSIVSASELSLLESLSDFWEAQFEMC